MPSHYDEDEDDRPRKSRRYRDDDDEDDQPRKKRRLKRPVRRKSSGSATKTGALLGGIALILLGIGLFVFFLLVLERVWIYPIILVIGGAVSMFPSLAAEWSEQVDARSGWKRFLRADFLALKTRYGVDWVVLQQPGSRGLQCPYQNDRVLVCRID